MHMGINIPGQLFRLPLVNFYNQSTMTQRVIIITGRKGYIASHLIDTALAMGLQVVSLARRPQKERDGLIQMTWAMGEPLPNKLESIINQKETSLVCCAHNWHGPDDSIMDINYSGTKVLISSAQRMGVSNITQLSTHSAHSNSISKYGKLKYELEKLAKYNGIKIVKIPLVFGGAPKSQFMTLLRIAKLPFRLKISPDVYVKPVHIDDVCKKIIEISFTHKKQEMETFQAWNYSTFSEAMLLIEKIYTRPTIKIITIPIPAKLIWFLTKKISKIFRSLHSLDEKLSGYIQADLDEAVTKNFKLIHSKNIIKYSPYEKRIAQRELIIEARIILGKIAKKDLRHSQIRYYLIASQTLNLQPHRGFELMLSRILPITLSYYLLNKYNSHQLKCDLATIIINGEYYGL